MLYYVRTIDLNAFTDLHCNSQQPIFLHCTSNAAKCVQMGSASIIVPITFMSSLLKGLGNGIFIGDMRGRIVQRTQFLTVFNYCCVSVSIGTKLA